MGAFLALLWDDLEPQARCEADALKSRVAGAGWATAYQGPGVQVWLRGVARLEIRATDRALVIGTCLRRGDTQTYRPVGAGPDLAPAAIASKFCRDAWGAYVVLGDGRWVFRDPSGGLDCLTWEMGRVRLVTSDAGWPPPGLHPPRCALDWRVIADWCVDSSRGATRAGLFGVEVVGPGSLLVGAGGESSQHLVWRPSRFIGAAPAAPSEISEGLRHAVAMAVEGLAQGHERLLHELSGGLDSAVVAAAGVERGLASRIAACLNYFGDRPEGDERVHAKAVAERLGLTLQCVGKPIQPLTEADFDVAAKGLRPGFATIDPVRDRDTAVRLSAAGATGLVTGHGGDAVFFQMPNLAIAADRRREAGLLGLTGGFLEDIARLTRRPTWDVLRAAFAKDESHASYRPPTLGHTDADTSAWIDPWTADCAAAPPAKRLQVRALHRAHLAMGWSHRGLEADVIHPLLSQPVMEFCLGLSATELTRGGRDRVVARDAYRGRLPDLVIDRRSKGDLTAHYGRVIAASLGFLRPLLLEGCLVEAGLLDRRRLEATLTPEQLMLERVNSEILVAAVIESWVRWWQTRVPDAPQGQRRV